MAVRMIPRVVSGLPWKVWLCSDCGAIVHDDDEEADMALHQAHHERIDRLEAAVAAFGAGDEYVELTGDDIPYHLRPDATPLGQCDRCERYTWSPDEIGTVDEMPQPSGGVCGGTLRAL